MIDTICRCGHVERKHIVIGCMDCLMVATNITQTCPEFISDNLKSLENAYGQRVSL
jgi:hypothetical protein